MTSGATLTEAAATLAAGHAGRTRRCWPPSSPRPRAGRGSVTSARDLRGCPEPAREGLRLLIDCRDAVAGLASSRPHPTNGRSHGDRCPRPERRSSRALPPHVEDKVGSLDRFDGKLKILRIDVELFHEKNPRQSSNCQRVEITLRGKGPVVRAEAAAPTSTRRSTPPAKLDARLRRAADRRRVHHGRRTPASVRINDNTAADIAAARPDWTDSSPTARTSPSSTSTCPGTSSGRSTTPRRR